MKGERLTILTSEAVAAENVDVESARAQYAEAEARIPSDAKTRDERAHQMKRAQVHQELAGAKQA